MAQQPTHHGPSHRPREHATSHLPRFRGAGANGEVSATREPDAPRPRWKLVIVIAIVIAVFLAIVIMHATGAMPKGTGI